MPTRGDAADGTRRARARRLGRPAGALTPWAVMAAFLALGGWLVAGLATDSDAARSLESSGAAEVPAPRLGPVSAAATEPATTAPTDSAASATAGESLHPLGNAGLVDPGWAVDAASRTGIPDRALLGYAGAELAMRAEAPGCHLGWNTLAALGFVESGHGTHAGSSLDRAGVAQPAILGPDLDGSDFDRIDDTDGGALDGSASTDRAVGPMQFLPSMWRQWGGDGDGDGIANPQQVDDAALAAARYLCVGGDLSDASAWRRAVFSYNHVEAYVDAVAAAAREYAERARG